MTSRPSTLPTLPKTLSRRDLFWFLICTLVGLDTLGSVASHGAQGFFWLLFLAAFFFVPYALCIAELGSAFPQEGGVYVWTRLAFGRPIAAMTTVFYWVSNPIWLGGALTTTASTTFSTFIFELGPVARVIFGLIIIWGCIFGIVLSLRHSKWISAFGAVARFCVLALFTVSVGIYAAVHGVHGIRLAELAPTMDGLFALVPFFFFNFVGFELPSSAGDEIENPRNDVPRAIRRAAIASVICYGVPILAILLVVPTENITGLKGFLDAMQLVFTVYGGHVSRAPDGSATVVLDGAGKLLGSVAALGFIAALATSAITWIIGADRSQAIACSDGAGPRALSTFSERWRSPVAVNVVSGAIATVVMLSAESVVGVSTERFFAAALSLGISTTTISYLGVFPALFVLRKKLPSAARPFRIPGGDGVALLVSTVLSGWALFASACLIWPGFGQRGPADAALPAGFVTLSAEGTVVSSQRGLFELTQVLPLGFFALVGVAFFLVGRRDRSGIAESVRRQRPPSLRPAAGTG